MTTEERLEKLERELGETKGALRRNRWISGVGVLAVLGCLTMASVRDNQVIRAHKFILEDAQGRARMFLASGQYGVGMTLMDESGKEEGHATFLGVISTGA